MIIIVKDDEDVFTVYVEEDKQVTKWINDVMKTLLLVIMMLMMMI